MKQISLYYSREENTYFHVGEIPCDGCLKSISEDFYFLEMDKKHEKHTTLSLCPKCFQENKGNITAQVIQYRQVVIAKIIPKGALPVIQKRQELSDGYLSVYDIGELKSDRTIDKTRYSGRESFQGLSIGCMPDSGHKKVDLDEHLKVLRLSKPDILKELMMK